MDERLEGLRLEHATSEFRKQEGVDVTYVVCSDCPDFRTVISENSKYTLQTYAATKEHLESTAHNSRVKARVDEKSENVSSRNLVIINPV